MRTLLVHAFALGLPGVCAAGSITIGQDNWRGGSKIGTCHLVTFSGPADAVKNYERRQKERFESVDAEVVEKLRETVSVFAAVETHKQPHCARDSGVPEKIVITAPGDKEPLLVIKLDPEQVKLANMLGAEFTAVNGSATVKPDSIRALAGREFDFHLVYSTHAYKDKWKREYAQKILDIDKLMK